MIKVIGYIIISISTFLLMNKAIPTAAKVGSLRAGKENEVYLRLLGERERPARGSYGREDCNKDYSETNKEGRPCFKRPDFTSLLANGTHIFGGNYVENGGGGSATNSSTGNNNDENMNHNETSDEQSEGENVNQGGGGSATNSSVGGNLTDSDNNEQPTNDFSGFGSHFGWFTGNHGDYGNNFGGFAGFGSNLGGGGGEDDLGNGGLFSFFSRWRANGNE